jgi:hypothetical protein
LGKTPNVKLKYFVFLGFVTLLARKPSLPAMAGDVSLGLVFMQPD